MQSNSIPSNSYSAISEVDGKVVVLGTTGVGKTSLAVSFIDGSIGNDISPTVGASFFTCKMMVKDINVKLQVWDTAGQERFRAMAPLYYRNAHAAILVYDITQRDSFNELNMWIKELKSKAPNDIAYIIVGNKSDLEDMRVITTDEASNFAKIVSAKHYEASALKHTGIDELFQEVGSAVLELRLKQLSKSVRNSNQRNITLPNKEQTSTCQRSAPSECSC